MERFRKSSLLLILRGRNEATARMPLDGISGIGAAYSLRRLLTTYIGPLVKLRRNSDDAESDFGYGVDGELDAAAVATWLGGATGYASVWYDQSGNGYDVAQADLTKQPLYQATGIAGKPALNADGTRGYMVYSGNFPGGSAGGIFAALRTPAAFAGSYIVTSADEVTTNYYLQLAVLATGKLYCTQRRNDVPDVISGNTALAVNTNYVWSFLSDDSAYTLRFNGGNDGITVLGGLNSGDWFTETLNRDNLVIGASKTITTTTGAKLTFREVVIIVGSPAPETVTSIENILGSGIGLALSLVLPVLGMLGFLYSSTIGT